MKLFLKIIASALLLFNGTGALFGGYNLVKFPDGNTIHLSPDWLINTPFPDYTIPGIVLFIVNGLFSFFVLIMLWKNSPNTGRWLIAQGLLLTSWIIVQMLFIRTVHFFHLILGSAGIALMVIGWLFMKKRNSNVNERFPSLTHYTPFHCAMSARHVPSIV